MSEMKGCTMTPIPVMAKQSELIAHIDKLIENIKKQLATVEKMRTTLLVQWFVKGDEKKFREIMVAERLGESWFKQAPQRARRYFTMYIEEWRKQHQPRTSCPDCNGTGFVHGTCCRKCEGSMSLLVKAVTQ